MKKNKIIFFVLLFIFIVDTVAAYELPHWMPEPAKKCVYDWKDYNDDGIIDHIIYGVWEKRWNGSDYCYVARKRRIATHHEAQASTYCTGRNPYTCKVI